jgi:hypothetical protein
VLNSTVQIRNSMIFRKNSMIFRKNSTVQIRNSHDFKEKLCGSEEKLPWFRG